MRVTGPGRGTRRLIAKAAQASRPHRAVRYRLAYDHGWDIVDTYELNRGTPAGTTRAIAERFCSLGVRMSEKFVRIDDTTMLFCSIFSFFIQTPTDGHPPPLARFVESR